MRFVAVRKLDYRILEIAELLLMTPAGLDMCAGRGAKAADRKLVEQLLES